jgi:glycosyltransferase involved in cell wall biosynthesis
MNILWLAPFPYGRRATAAHPAPWLAVLARALATVPGVRLTVLACESGLPTAEETYEAQGVRFVFLNAPGTRLDLLTLYTRRVALLRAWLRRHHREYDILHVHGSEYQFPAATAGLGRPVLLSVQGLLSECLKYLPAGPSWRRALWTLGGYYERCYLPLVQEFSCRTVWDKAHAAHFNPQARIHHNWEMLRPEFWGAAPRPAAGTPAPARPQFLFMGGTQVLKGFRETLLAFDLVRAQGPARLVLVGDSVPAQLAAHLQAHPPRYFDPQHDLDLRRFQDTGQLLELFRTSVGLLHPSYIDNSPNSVCEAQVAGLPVVASAVGGVPSLITDNETGLLTTLDPQCLAAQALRLSGDPALARRLATQARAVAEARHDPAIILSRTLAIYEKIRT